MPAASIGAKLTKGSKYGRWTVIGAPYTHQTLNKCYVLCECECGTVRAIAGSPLINNCRTNKSCGCYRTENSKSKATTHGMSQVPEYAVWQSMKYRCDNPKCPMYKYYGGKGIKVCKRWQRFENFIADMGRRPSPQHSIDRKKNNKGYYKSNCRWVTINVQSNNRTRCVYLKVGRKTLTKKQWCDLTGVKRGALDHRLEQGVNLARAVQPGKLKRGER